ncbi:resolvase [Terribacillus saccharophilus]|uniref:recombinase family protein n=1 Tax=Terribacillus saccharophilus TaxID=361277 RepID=UPI000BA67B82|nr:recombinase family protein [Terribacillus saccharophilus]PAF20074.1 resolvase [Terribacillus saccharophilus]
MSKIGYARVSTKDQNLEPQIEALEKEGCSKVFSEKVSGRKQQRTELDKCLEYLRQGDTLVVYKLDRLGRTTKQLINLVGDLSDQGINFKSISNNIDTSTPQGKFFFTIMAGFAEMEAELNRERTMTGLASARARGRKGGRPSKDATKALKLYHSKEYSVAEISEMTGISQSKIYKELQKEKLQAIQDELNK